MKQGSLRAVQMRMEAAGRPNLTSVPGLKESKVKVALKDVVLLDMRGSVTGLYKRSGHAQVLGIDKLKRHSGEVLVSCGRKLDEKEKKDLAEQGMKVIYVREDKIGHHVVRGMSGERYADTEPNGSKVLNYLVLNKDQAKRLLRDASIERVAEPQVPVQVECHVPVEAAGLALAMAMYGGC